MKQQKLIVREVPVELLKPNGWNTNHVSPENEEKLRASIERFGFTRPIIARENEGSNKFEILGGEHRFKVARDMGFETVPVVVLAEVDDQTAKEIGLVDNGRYGEDDTLGLSELLKSLGDIEDLTAFLPINTQEIENLFTASSINLDTLGIDDDESIETLAEVAEQKKNVHTSQLFRFKVPIEDADYITKLIDSTMKTNGFTGEDSLTNAGHALLHLLRST